MPIRIYFLRFFLVNSNNREGRIFFLTSKDAINIKKKQKEKENSSNGKMSKSYLKKRTKILF